MLLISRCSQKENKSNNNKYNSNNRRDDRSNLIENINDFSRIEYKDDVRIETVTSSSKLLNYLIAWCA